MALARAWSIAVVGVQGHRVEVEADLAQGLPGLMLVGLPDAALHEARDRVRAAVVNSGFAWPAKRITLGLFPATLPKAGSHFDVAIAASILAAAGQIPVDALTDRVLLGELALDGRMRPVSGVLPAVLAAAREGLVRAVVPVANAREAAVVPGVTVEAVRDLRSLVAFLRGDEQALAEWPAVEPAGEPPHQLDLAQVVGQWEARHAIEVSAAGGHHLLLQGPPGTGKTMLAERLPGLLPDLDDDEALEVTGIHSVAGVLPPGASLVTRPPLRAPHHSATQAALIGGGSGTVRPGAASLAHRGVLFLDEAPEFARSVLDALRQPLESGSIEIARVRMTARFPARFTLVLAANPCPCAAAEGDELACGCTPMARRRYWGRLSGPLLDRVDLQVRTRKVTRAELTADAQFTETTAVVSARVAAARKAAVQRLAGTPWRRNADVPGGELRARWPLSAAASRVAERALDAGSVSARGFDRVCRLAWTLADLAGSPGVERDHVEQALVLRHGRPA